MELITAINLALLCVNFLLALLLGFAVIYAYRNLKPILQMIQHYQEVMLGKEVLVDQIERFHLMERLAEAVTVLRAQMDLMRRKNGEDS